MESPKRSWAKDSLDLFLTSDQEGKKKMIFQKFMKQRFEKKTSCKEDDISLRDIDREDIIDDSEYDEIILEKYDEDVTFIG